MLWLENDGENLKYDKMEFIFTPKTNMNTIHYYTHRDCNQPINTVDYYL